MDGRKAWSGNFRREKSLKNFPRLAAWDVIFVRPKPPRRHRQGVMLHPTGTVIVHEILNLTPGTP